MKKKPINFLFIFSLLISLSFILAGSSANCRESSLNQKLKKINLDQIDNVMIVAHPDDETIFGGNHLRKDHYLIVCITAGSNPIREKELKQLAKKYNDSCIILNYPDKTMGKRDSWKHSYGSIYHNLETILKQKEFQMVVTHNPDGEYGHIHHKMVSKMVTSIANYAHANSSFFKLYYFNHYYKASFLKVHPQKECISEAESLSKYQYLKKYYHSQSKVIESLKHILPYEQLIPQASWKSK